MLRLAEAAAPRRSATSLSVDVASRRSATSPSVDVRTHSARPRVQRRRLSKYGVPSRYEEHFHMFRQAALAHETGKNHIQSHIHSTCYLIEMFRPFKMNASQSNMYVWFAQRPLFCGGDLYMDLPSGVLLVLQSCIFQHPSATHHPACAQGSLAGRGRHTGENRVAGKST